MSLQSLYLRNFRNLSELEAIFSPSINILYGENAQGKTNLLEAIYLIATGRSFRTPHLHELIREGENFFFLEAILRKEEFEHTLQISFDGKAKKLILDGNTYTSFQHLLGLLPSVLHTPWDQELIDGPPNVRRKFCNIHLAQKDPLYIHHLSRYWRALKQRNFLLKVLDDRGIECWELEMAESANYLWKTRQQFFEALQPALQSYGSLLSSGKERHTIRFLPGANSGTNLEHYLILLNKNRAREKQWGNTLLGPHRDDFCIEINEKIGATFASEGQKKTAVFGLRMAEWELFSQESTNVPLLGIDDLGLHLDPTRHNLFRNTLPKLGQTFITTPCPFDLPDARQFLLENGKIH